MAATAQAAHLHAPAHPGRHLQAPSSVSSQALDDESHCPLCVAAHQALPAPLFALLAQPVLAEQLLEREGQQGTAATWHFARLSRPPPSLE